MSYALINEHKYELNNYYTDSNGNRLILYVVDSEELDIRIFELDIKSTGEVKVYNDKDELLSNYGGYSKFASLEKQFSNGINQWYVILKQTSVAQTVDAVNKDITAYKTSVNNKLEKLQTANNKYSEDITNLKTDCNNLSQKIEDLQLQIQQLTPALEAKEEES